MLLYKKTNKRIKKQQTKTKKRPMHIGPAVIGARCCLVPAYFFRLLIFVRVSMYAIV